MAARDHVVLDDATVRIRTNDEAQRFTELFELRADQSIVSTSLGGRPTANQVTAETEEAIIALIGNAPRWIRSSKLQASSTKGRGLADDDGSH